MERRTAGRRRLVIGWLICGVAVTCLRGAWAEQPDVEELVSRAQLAAREDQSERAIELATQALARDPDASEALYLRGRERFRRGQFLGSLADFDRLIKVRPGRAPSLWERGISCYYAGRYDDGVKQFSAYQGFDDSDVENAVWHVLCLSRLEGLPTARRQMLRIRDDRRLPMRSVYEMFEGTKTPADVLGQISAADVTPAQRHAAYFYGHLYIGLYYEAEGDAAKARSHLTTAAQRYPIDHYMWDVARVHATYLLQHSNTESSPRADSDVP